MNNPVEQTEKVAEELAREERRRMPLVERFAKVGFTLRSCRESLATKPEPPAPLVEGACRSSSVMEIIGQSKTGKTFFTIQFACSLATGRPFLGRKITRPCKTLYVNLELAAVDFELRLWEMRKELGLEDDKLLQDNLFLLHARGRGVEVREELLDLVKDSDLDVVILDTRYKLHAPGESENTPEGLAGIIAFQDQLADCGPLVVMVGHDAKGLVGDRSDIDRGAGSNWAGRDCDTRWILTPHDKDPKRMAVMSVVYRHFSWTPDQSLTFTDKCTFELSDAPAIKLSSRSPGSSRKTPPAASHGSTVVAILEKSEKPLPKGVLVEKLREEAGLGEKAARKAVDVAVANGIVKQTDRQHEKNGSKLIGTPEQLDLLDYIQQHTQEEGKLG